jgi:hypothetical protein
MRQTFVTCLQDGRPIFGEPREACLIGRSNRPVAHIRGGPHRIWQEHREETPERGIVAGPCRKMTESFLGFL